MDGVIIRAMAVARRRRYQLLIVVAMGSVPLTIVPAPTMNMIRCESPGKCVQWSMMNAATMVVSPNSVTRRGPQRSIAQPTNGMRSIGRALANIHSQGGQVRHRLDDGYAREDGGGDRRQDVEIGFTPDGKDEGSDQYDLPALETTARERRWLDAHGV